MKVAENFSIHSLNFGAPNSQVKFERLEKLAIKAAIMNSTKCSPSDNPTCEPNTYFEIEKKTIQQSRQLKDMKLITQ